MSETPLPRETGSEKVDATCPECGEPLTAVTSGYGSVVTGVCPCQATDEEPQLESQKAQANGGQPPVALVPDLASGSADPPQD